MDWYWLLALVLVILGFAGLAIPVIPGIVLIFSGLLLGAWIDNFARVSEITMVIIAVIALIAWVIDFSASYITAKKAKASKLALWGTLIGAMFGMFAGVVGIIVGPIIGAVIGELITMRNTGNATRVGIAAGLGFVLALVIKFILSLLAISIFAYAYFY
ncbi:MAG TPA: DUF456 domain-containing protein [Methylophilaceae bacterium]|nr:DUF456 domain-containing protein [Methylophilaceae bacterium]